jgi:hypothetical protein
LWKIKIRLPTLFHIEPNYTITNVNSLQSLVTDQAKAVLYKLTTVNLYKITDIPNLTRYNKLVTADIKPFSFDVYDLSFVNR